MAPVQCRLSFTLQRDERDAAARIGFDVTILLTIKIERIHICIVK